VHEKVQIPKKTSQHYTPIGPLDALIAAHAKSLNHIPVTNNEREFRRIDQLKVENWVE
jgi:tRNA(fMet)-specific endonuclease VapC